MCGPPYDREYGVPNIDNEYTIQTRLGQYYSYLKNHKYDETEEEYFNRLKRKKIKK
jgi:hypothetical protein